MRAGRFDHDQHAPAPRAASCHRDGNDMHMQLLGLFGGVIAAVCAALPAQAADAARGKVLYETRCTACHATSVHLRKARKASSFNEVRKQVARWSAELRSGWSADEIDDVTLYLNDRYYRFPCPDAQCGSAQARAIAPRPPGRGG